MNNIERNTSRSLFGSELTTESKTKRSLFESEKQLPVPTFPEPSNNNNLQEKQIDKIPEKQDNTPASPTKKRKLNQNDITDTKVRSIALFGTSTQTEEQKPIFKPKPTSFQQGKRKNLIPHRERTSSLNFNPNIMTLGPDTALLIPTQSIQEGSNVLIDQNENLKLKKIGSGNFHNAWIIEGKEHLVIKTLRGDLNINQKEESYKDTLKAYDLLTKQAASQGDFSVARLINQTTIGKDGFYVYEFIQGEKPKFQDVKEIFIKMIDDPLRFIADFRPDNLRIQNGKIVIIDPSIEKGFIPNEKMQDEFKSDPMTFINDFALHMHNLLLSWTYDDNNVVDPKLLSEVLQLSNSLSMGSKFVWERIEQKIEEKILNNLIKQRDIEWRNVVSKTVSDFTTKDERRKAFFEKIQEEMKIRSDIYRQHFQEDFSEIQMQMENEISSLHDTLFIYEIEFSQQEINEILHSLTA